jgi:hypothetical protein
MSNTSVGPPPQPWGSIADVKHLEASPLSAATMLARIFGTRAATIAACCALDARAKGELERYQLWLGAFKHLKLRFLRDT